MTTVIRWLGLAVVLAAAAVLSFHGLRDLAVAVSIPAELAWLLPVAVDAGAAVSCACWLGRDLPRDAQAFARRLTYSLLLLTVAGNAAQLGMSAGHVTPPWWVAVLVGAIPPAVVGGTVHLAVLVGRTQDQPRTEPLHVVQDADPRAARDEVAKQFLEANPEAGARRLAAHLTENGHPLSPSGAASAYLKSG